MEPLNMTETELLGRLILESIDIIRAKALYSKNESEIIKHVEIIGQLKDIATKLKTKS